MVAQAGGVDEAFRVYYGHVFRYLLRRTRNRSEAEDLTQEVFAAAVRGPAPRGPVLPWLYRVAQRRHADELRRNGHFFAPLDAALARGEGPRGAATALRAAFRALPPDQAKVIGMRLIQGRPFDEIAAALSTSEGACKMRFHRGIRTLRAELARSGFEPGAN